MAELRETMRAAKTDMTALVMSAIALGLIVGSLSTSVGPLGSWSETPSMDAAGTGPR